MQFATKASSLSLLTDLGVTHVSLANNHSRDYGPEGYRIAKSTLRGMDIVPFGDAHTVGTSSIVYLESDTITIAVIAIHTLFQELDLEVLRTVLDEARQRADYQFVYIHWGNEYELTHSSQQRKLAEWFNEQEVDAVIGHHPHVVQDIEMIGDMPVFYSLGNFIFDQYFSADVKTGLVLRLDATEDSLLWKLYPQQQCAKATPCLMATTTENSFLEALATRSDKTLSTQIMAKNIAIPR